MNIPCESQFPGFFRVAWTNEVVVSEDGLVMNTRTGNLLKPILRNHGYLSVNLVVKGKEKQFLLHRLIAGAFIPIPVELQGLKKLQVNHKDGDKTNNLLSNLEWMRPQQNMQHAFKNKLINFSTPVLSKDVRTGEVVRYNSASELALELDIGAKMLRRHLCSEFAGKQTIDWKVFKYEDSNGWPAIADDWKVPTTFNCSTAFVIKDLETKQIILSPTLKRFCEAAGIEYNHLKNHRSFNGFSKPFRKRYVFLEVENYQSLNIDVVLDFCIRGVEKDKRIFRVIDSNKKEHHVVGILSLCKYIGYNYGYVANRISGKTEVDIAEFKILTLPRV